MGPAFTAIYCNTQILLYHHREKAKISHQRANGRIRLILVGLTVLVLVFGVFCLSAFQKAQVRGLVFERVVPKGEQAVATLPGAGNPVGGVKRGDGKWDTEDDCV